MKLQKLNMFFPYKTKKELYDFIHWEEKVDSLNSPNIRRS